MAYKYVSFGGLRKWSIRSTFLLLCIVMIVCCFYFEGTADTRRFRFANKLTDRWLNSSLKRDMYNNSNTNITQNKTSSMPRPTLSQVDIDPTSDKQTTCKPHQTLVFLKTHKTGSSTLTTTLERYGYTRNLTIAIPKRNLHIISSGIFDPKQVYPGKFDMLVNHVRFNKTAMQKVMKPNATYFTIIRDPRTQIESVFGYFLVFKALGLPETTGFRTFTSKPKYYWDKHPTFGFRNHMKNPNLYDLGLDMLSQENMILVDAAIERFRREFDLVLINEYYNESLLLLKKLLCFSFEDLLYLPKGIRSAKRRYAISDKSRESINKWSWADARLYQEFNKTFWERVEDYGPTFQDDLKYFESRLEEKLRNCSIANTTKDNKAHREALLVLHPNADPSCKLMMKSDPELTKLIRNKQYGHSAQKRPLVNKSANVKKPPVVNSSRRRTVVNRSARNRRTHKK